MDGGIELKRIAVYCGASKGNNVIYEKAAVQIGNWIVDQEHELVYGGGKAGLMGVLADTVIQRSGIVTGVIPTFLQARELAHEQLNKIIIVSNMHERKAKMIELADCYIAIPGGPGTLEEITEVISWGRIGQHVNPCIFYNVNGYYDLIGQFYDKMVEEGFLTKTDRQKILVTDSLDEINTFISTYVPPDIRQYN
ncbi:TIGR00730 family Rossman fold protein [Paenibacillus sp. AD87]|uniref:LOG family protein n=1 Tax=Paenibacillus sp. AD87 TaxID=1528787 RepID=UPI0007E42B10|nr:TIGR00730 family Rossman fold protein [Paenibacillus sp. AD87]